MESQPNGNHDIQSQRPLTNRRDPPCPEVEKGIKFIRKKYSIAGKLAESSLSRSGKRQARKLAKIWGIPEAEARRHVQFRQSFTKAELEELFEMFREACFVLSFTHFRIVLAIKDRALRRELIRQILEGRLGTVRARQLKDRLVNNPAPQGGRKSQLLVLDEEEVEWLLEQDEVRLCRKLRLVISQRPDMQPDRLRRLQQRLDRLQ